MDEESINAKSRRSLLRGTVLLAGIGAIPLLVNVRAVLAEGKLAKAVVKYQDKPNAGKDCDDCLQYIPAATPGAKPTCKIVEGFISPHGYCDAFTRKPKRS